MKIVIIAYTRNIETTLKRSSYALKTIPEYFSFSFSKNRRSCETGLIFSKNWWHLETSCASNASWYGSSLGVQRTVTLFSVSRVRNSLSNLKWMKSQLACIILLQCRQINKCLNSFRHKSLPWNLFHNIWYLLIIYWTFST